MIPFLQNTRKYNASYQKKKKKEEEADKSMMTWGLGVQGGCNTFESDGYVHSFDHEL